MKTCSASQEPARHFIAILKNTMLLLVLGLPSALSAQKQATWKGGAPGRSTDWNCSANWKEGRVPNVFCDVVIPVVDFIPHIRIEADGINSLTLMPGAELCIEKSGVLEVLGWLNLFGASKIQNAGKLLLPENSHTPKDKPERGMACKQPAKLKPQTIEQCISVRDSDKP